jgi:membrane protease YdiL (CAAX protease family)
LLNDEEDVADGAPPPRVDAPDSAPGPAELPQIAQPPPAAPTPRPPGFLSLTAWMLFFGANVALAWYPFFAARAGDPGAFLRPGVLDDPAMVAVAIAGSWFGFLVAAVLVWRARLSRRDTGWVALAPRRLWAWTALTLLGLLVTWGAATLVLGNHLQIVEPLTRAPRGTAHWLLWIGLAWSAGITEEFVMRGYGIGLLVRLGANRWAAAAGMSILFGSLHVYEGVHAVPLLAVWGLVFATSYLKTGSILPGVLAHALVDGVAPLLIGR